MWNSRLSEEPNYDPQRYADAMDVLNRLEVSLGKLQKAEFDSATEVARHKINLENMINDERASAIESIAKKMKATDKEIAKLRAKYSDDQKNKEIEATEFRLQQMEQEQKDLEAYDTYREEYKKQAMLIYATEHKKSVVELSQAEIDAALDLHEAKVGFMDDEAAYIKKLREKDLKDQEKDLKEQTKKRRLEGAAAYKALFSKSENAHSFKDIIAEKTNALKALTKGPNKPGPDGNQVSHVKAGNVAMLALKVLGDIASKLEPTIDEIAGRKSSIDTRLQGALLDKEGRSFYNEITNKITGSIGISPYVEQKKLYENLQKLVDSGIAFDIEQRAFLATISDKIATTFNAFDSSLTRLIRIQQADTTAGRLGMESALNAFLNNMYQSSEYLNSMAVSVRDSLYELEALSKAGTGTEIEAQVQKWLGSLYSVGMSDGAISGIAGAFGQIAAGDISSLTGGNGFGNLMVMAANRAGLPLSSILTSGIDAGGTNQLLRSMVEYLAEITNNTKDNRVVQQQIAKVYGLTASDLRAIANLADDKTLMGINKFNLTYGDMLGRLDQMFSSVEGRLSAGEKISNLVSNAKYSFASSVGGDSVLYTILKVGGLLEEIGGSNLPTITALGNGIDLETNLAGLIRGAALSTGILKDIGKIIEGTSKGVWGKSMLKAFGISEWSPWGGTTGKIPIVSRGEGNIGFQTSGSSVSMSGSVGNSSGADIKDITLQNAYDDAQNQHISATENEMADIPNKTVNESILKIYALLQDAVSGSVSISVRTNGGSRPSGGWTSGPTGSGAW